MLRKEVGALRDEVGALQGHLVDFQDVVAVLLGDIVGNRGDDRQGDREGVTHNFG